MNARQNSKNSMYQSVLSVLTQNQSVYAAVTALVAAVDKYSTFFQALQVLIEQQRQIILGYAADKRNKRISMVYLAIKAKGAVQAYATESDNPILFEAVDFEEAKMMIERASYARAHAQLIHQNAIAAIDALNDYGLSPDDLTALQAAINAFALVASMPKSKKAELKTITKQLSEQFAKIDNILRNQLDRNMLIYKSSPTASGFWLLYHNARKIYNPAYHITQVQATIFNSDTNQPMPNVKMIITQGTETFEEISNDKGIAAKKQMHPELTQLSFEIPGFQPVSSTVSLSPGEKEEVIIKMKPIS